MPVNDAAVTILASRLPGGPTRRRFLGVVALAGLAGHLGVDASWAAEASAAGDAALSTRRKFMDSFYTLNNDYINEMDQGATLAASKLNIAESREINNADVNVRKATSRTRRTSASTASLWWPRPKAPRSTCCASSTG